MSTEADWSHIIFSYSLKYFGYCFGKWVRPWVSTKTTWSGIHAQKPWKDWTLFSLLSSHSTDFCDSHLNASTILQSCFLRRHLWWDFWSSKVFSPTISLLESTAGAMKVKSFSETANYSAASFICNKCVRR